MPIDSSHQPEARRAFVTVSALTVLLVLITGTLVPTTSPKTPQFIYLHIALETLTLIISGSIFAIAWSSKHESLSRNIIVLASAFLGVALLDFSQMLSYEGMPAFLTPNSSEKSTYFWFAARLLGSVALVAVAVLSWKKKGSVQLFRLQLLLVLTVVAASYVVYFHYREWLPRTLIKGDGLASFKFRFEYVLISLNLLAAGLFAWRMQEPRRFNASGLFAAACIMAQSKFFFTLYADVADAYTLVGHFYKVLGYAFLFHAVFIETVSHPYTQLRESQQRLQATLEALPDLVFEMDRQGRFLAVYASSGTELSVPVDRLLGLRVQDIMTAEANTVVMAALAQASSLGVSRGKVIELLIEGQSRWFELSVTSRSVDLTPEERFIVISRDITGRVKNEQFLRTLSLAIKQSPIALIVADPQHRITMVNDAYTRISGYTEQELLGNRSFDVLKTHSPVASRQSILQQLAEGKPWQGEMVGINKESQKYALSALVYPVHNHNGEIVSYIAHLENITEKKRAAQRIHQLSFYEQLTGLPNQAALQEHFHYVSQKTRSIALLWIDLDHFKNVNDSLGHQTGDELLLEMSRRLRGVLRTQDYLAHLSGDKFAVVLPDMSHKDVAAFAQTLLEVVSQPLQLSCQDISLTASIGIAFYPSGADRFETLLQRAEAAMYQAKSEGRNATCFFVPEIQAEVLRLLRLSNALKQALNKGELTLV